MVGAASSAARPAGSWSRCACGRVVLRALCASRSVAAMAAHRARARRSLGLRLQRRQRGVDMLGGDDMAEG